MHVILQKLMLVTLLFIPVLYSVSCSKPVYSTIQDKDNHYQEVENIDCCDDFSTQVVNLRPNEEVCILVHGCRGSSGYFSTLKKVFESRGQQALCFSYNYRDKIENCATELVSAIEHIDRVATPSKITVIGHSQGGLVARRALTTERKNELRTWPQGKINLVTISTPFNGIYASDHCGITALHIVSIGLTVAVCKGITGKTWTEINPRSDFILEPGIMASSVNSHLKIVTDESDICRQSDIEGNCLKRDSVFSVEEQYNPAVDSDSRVHTVEIQAGHSLVVGTSGHPPLQLIDVLEKNNVLQSDTTTAPQVQSAFLSALYP